MNMGSIPAPSVVAGVRRAARIAVLAGGIGSVSLMLYAAHRKNAPAELRILFALWVFFPSLAFFLADLFSRNWSPATRGSLYRISLVLSIVSLAIFGADAFSGPRTFLFVLLPPVSIVLAASGVAIAARISTDFD